MDKMVETVEEAKDWVDHGMMNCGPQTLAAIRILRDHVDKIESCVAYQSVREETRKWLTETLQENVDLASIVADLEKRICYAGELHLADESTIYQLQNRAAKLEGLLLEALPHMEDREGIPPIVDRVRYALREETR